MRWTCREGDDNVRATRGTPLKSGFCVPVHESAVGSGRIFPPASGTLGLANWEETTDFARLRGSMKAVMERRAFIGTLAGGLLAGHLAGPARAQPKARRLAFLTPRSRPSSPDHDAFSEAFVQGMRDLGYVEGANLVVEWRYANGNYKSLPDLAAEIIHLEPEVIVTYGTAAAQALKKATSSIPIVVAAAVDLVGSGIVESLRRPGGNVTGLSAIGVDLSPKHLELLRTAMPRLASVAVLINPGNSTHPAVLKNVEAAAERLALKVVPTDARVPNDIEGAFAVASRKGAGAVIVATDAFYSGQGPRLAAASLKHHLPTISIYDESVQAGCLMSYGQNIAGFHRQAATYVDKILKGARPADLPIEQPTTFELAINLKAARALGLTIPPSLLQRADQVIES
jgi:putative tryptophan/tyrosine transport system substrate-binding protein